jgi:hypothetical protein
MRLHPSSTFIFILVMLAALSTDCGGRALNKKTAQGAILESTRGMLRADDVDVIAADQTGADQAVVTADVRVALAMEKVKGRWAVQDVRLGRHSWERWDNILQALESMKIQETRDSMQKVAAALEKYHEEKHSLPDFRDFVTLTDALSPNYLTPLIRLDAWRNPLLAFRVAPSVVRLLSTGPDGQAGTADDIELTRAFPP